MRYEMEGDTLQVMRDSPFLRAYKIDYLSASRNVKMTSTATTQFGSSSASSSGTGANANIDVSAQNNLWESIVQNVRDILRETDRIIPAGAALATPPAAAPAPAVAAPGAQPPIPAQPTLAVQPSA